MGCGPIGGSPISDPFGGYGFVPQQPQPYFAQPRPQPRLQPQPAPVAVRPAPKPLAPVAPVVPVRVVVAAPADFGIDLSEPLSVPPPAELGIDLP